ncbi:MAG: hypothetical protein J6572_10435 [Gilliamella sp.]|nr:hypothetical protein [Gilliamella sp.]
MGLFSRLFRRDDNEIQQSDDIFVPNSSIENPLSLIVLFNGKLSFNQHKLLKTLRKIDSSMKNIRLQSSIEQIADGADIHAVFGKHIIKIVCFNSPCSAEILEPCIESSQKRQDFRQQVYHHQSHIILYYVGFEEDLVEQYVALTQFAVGFEHSDMCALINAKAHQILATHVAVHWQPNKKACICYVIVYLYFLLDLRNLMLTILMAYGCVLMVPMLLVFLIFLY